MDSELTSDDEASPLLPKARKPTPLPTAQLAALCVCRLMDPIAMTQIFPYILEWLTVLKVSEPSKIGIYSGLVVVSVFLEESTFAITQTLTSYHWAKLSDVVGRRPIILVCTGGLAIVTLLLGLCTSFSQIMLARACGGFLAGNIAVYLAVLAEITDATNLASVYPIYSFTWPFGGTIGPLIGGSLADLGTKYPEYFGNNFLLAYPYFMPNFVCALLAFVGFLLTFFFLEETLPSKRRGQSISTAVQVPSPSMSAWDILSIPMIRAVTFSAFVLSFLGGAFDVVFVLYAYTSIENGGLSFSVNQIGYALSLSGAILALFQLFFMPHLLRRYNPTKMYNAAMRFWPLTFILIPFLNVVARTGVEHNMDKVNANIILWLCLALVLICSRIASLAYATNLIIIRNHAPNPSSLGAANGVIQFAMCISRCFSPALVSTIFALSQGNNLLGGYPIWVVMMLLVCLVGCYFSQEMVRIEEASRVVQ
ncbi:major facilitator superfamily domain-containing protein [Roridomyces roridus]|uniref:Major facilitator superfamily domain-containing protein n=1 Tax=Roridomyces roridus TaxID=1738132 RepID=A0AAD7BVW6_9AGAR|nr:major facilitator superfamily domain-containing protein [Roridomyces roridus]